jgi:glycosyltransferase involved in cell wall biosynthesis
MNEIKKVSIAVCGKFHYTNYVRFIESAGKLERFYFSHKLSTNSKSLGIKKNQSVNAFIKEYLAVLHEKIQGTESKMKYMTFYQDLWEDIALLYYKKAAIFHVLNHGTSARLLKRYKADGALTLGEPLNSHPRYMNELLDEEYERLGIKKKMELHATQKRMIEETDLFDFILTPSNFVKNSYIKYGFPEDKIFNIPIGVDVNKFKKFDTGEIKSNKIFRVFYVGQIIPRKAHIDLLEAWKKLKLPNAELVFIGSLSDEMIPILKKYEGLHKNLGTLSHTEIVENLNQSSVFVMPSVEEGCAFAPIEAMSCGVPVILSTNTGSGELVTEGKEGFIVPIRQPDKIAEKILQLYNDREMAIEMGKNARALATSSLNWEQYANQLMSVYDKMLGSENARN